VAVRRLGVGDVDSPCELCSASDRGGSVGSVNRAPPRAWAQPSTHGAAASGGLCVKRASTGYRPIALRTVVSAQGYRLSEERPSRAIQNTARTCKAPRRREAWEAATGDPQSVRFYSRRMQKPRGGGRFGAVAD